MRLAVKYIHEIQALTPFYIRGYRISPIIFIDICLSLVYTLNMKSNGPLVKCTGFEWDKGNDAKNWKKHSVSYLECEQIFFNQPLITQHDEKHSITETRYYALGRTDANRRLFVVFTIRNNLIRVISARDMNRKERKVYEK